MTAVDRAVSRREITDALLKAMERRHEVLDVIVDSDDRASAVKAIAELLGTSHLGCEAVIGMSLDQLTKDSRDRIRAELEDLNNELTFTLGERPASVGETLALRPFTGSDDRDIFALRTEDVGASGDGSGSPARGLDDEIRAVLGRIDDEDAALFVAIDGGQKIGLVFGDLNHGEVNVRIWIEPQQRKKGYGTAALRRARSELAACFPGVPLVVRAPGAHAG
ncbi:GNAT family N-acetyltransferase [Mycobacterium sp. M1]|uniref:GNAT family N-acetyltransferase n=1 Tax=Mycolicibacter acidiphilus TaxID=2835306 RepID=A0ABS5RIS2_9MYCO|nr:GNAT family N-acetyltransferase [Mycolicibacter acidiphilus]MBS9534196.1 GNAT family N-acetyltransferase [Mycolicibacter acidiphilus]